MCTSVGTGLGRVLSGRNSPPPTFSLHEIPHPLSVWPPPPPPPLPPPLPPPEKYYTKALAYHTDVLLTVTDPIQITNMVPRVMCALAEMYRYTHATIANRSVERALTGLQVCVPPSEGSAQGCGGRFHPLGTHHP